LNDLSDFEAWMVTNQPEIASDFRNSGLNVFKTAGRFLLASGPGLNQFRVGFWTLTTARFPALHEFHLHVGGSLIHVESDNLVFPAFSQEVTDRMPGSIGFPMLKPCVGIGSLVIFKDLTGSTALATYIEQNWDQKINGTTCLSWGSSWTRTKILQRN